MSVIEIRHCRVAAIIEGILGWRISRGQRYKHHRSLVRLLEHVMPLMSRTAIAIVIGLALALVVGIGTLFSSGSKATIGRCVVGIVDAIFPQVITVGWKMSMIFMLAKGLRSPEFAGIVVVMIIVVIGIGMVIVVVVIVIIIIVVIVSALTLEGRILVLIVIVVVVVCNLLFVCKDVLKLRNGMGKGIMVEQAIDCSTLTLVDAVHDDLLDVIVGELKIGSVRNQQSFIANRTDTGNESLSVVAILVSRTKRTEVLKDLGSGTSREVLGNQKVNAVIKLLLGQLSTSRDGIIDCTPKLISIIQHGTFPGCPQVIIIIVAVFCKGLELFAKKEEHPRFGSIKARKFLGMSSGVPTVIRGLEHLVESNFDSSKFRDFNRTVQGQRSGLVLGLIVLTVKGMIVVVSTANRAVSIASLIATVATVSTRTASSTTDLVVVVGHDRTQR